MKNRFTILALSTVLALAFGNFFMAGCTKEGPEGKPGLDGIDGQDGALSCIACHNMSEFLKARIDQYSHSVHAKGANANQVGENCSMCHTSMGFRNFIADGHPGIINNPTSINCRTCHPIHESYTSNDFNLRTTDAVSLMVGNATYDYGASNLCVNCHQGRPVNPYPVPGQPDITITNARYGPHYGPQANMFSGNGPVTIAGSMEYVNSAHTKLITDGCITCHMSPATGIVAGGHQMNVKYTTPSGSTAYQYTGCLASGCHSTVAAVTALIDPNRAEIKTLLAQLKGRLQEKDLLNASEMVPVPKTMTQLEAAAIINYKFIYGDHSYGAHNYPLTKALLVNTLESLSE
jgi:hypothetical protein